MERRARSRFGREARIKKRDVAAQAAPRQPEQPPQLPPLQSKDDGRVPSVAGAKVSDVKETKGAVAWNVKVAPAKASKPELSSRR